MTGQRDAAQSFAIRAQQRIKLADQGPLRDFTGGKADKAVTAILGADHPVLAAKSIASTAYKDSTSKALASVKGAFSDYLTQDAKKLPALLANGKVRSAMSQVFSAQEMGRFDPISKAMQKVNGSAKDVGDVLNSPAARIVEMAARFLAVQAASGTGNNTGAQLQIANMASGNAKRFVENMTNQRARQMLVNAIEDPALFRALLATPEAVQMDRELRSKLAPYVLGGLSGLDDADF